MTGLELSQAEAGILFSALLSFSDDELSEEEGIVMRKYYRYETAEILENKMKGAGYRYPEDLEALEPRIIEVLKGSDRIFQLRTLAIGIELAMADGNYDAKEMAFLQRYGDELGISLGEARAFGRSYLVEIDENEKYCDALDMGVLHEVLNLTINEAGIALCALVAFSDDDPSEAEVAVMREYFVEADVEGLQKKMTASARIYPDDLGTLEGDILSALSAAQRGVQVKMLSIAYKVAGADGVLEAAELYPLERLCEELAIGIRELGDYFKAQL